MKAIIASVFLLLSAPAFAVEIDFKPAILDAAEKPAQDCDHINQDDPKNPFCDKMVPLTLGRLAAAAVDQYEANLKPADIVARGSLARRIRKSLGATGKLDLDPRDIDLIKDQLTKMHIAPSYFEQANEALSATQK